jgi:hypothetical protein
MNNKENQELVVVEEEKHFLPANDRVIEQLEAITKFQQLIQSQFKKGLDYGQTSNSTTDKPSLLKSGAEKIIMLLGLRSQFIIDKEIEDHKNGYFFYRIRCQLIKNDEVITEGLGSCNSEESKFILKEKKNRRTGEVYYAPTEDDQKRYKYTIANTILKMAKKRSMVDAVLIVASLSNIFTQDIEDFEISKNNTTQEKIDKHIDRVEKKNEKFEKNKKDVEIKVKENETRRLLDNMKTFIYYVRGIENLSTVKLENDKFCTKLIERIGKQHNEKLTGWRDLGSFQVFEWIKRLKNKDHEKRREMIDRIQQALDELIEEETNKNLEKQSKTLETKEEELI